MILPTNNRQPTASNQPDVSKTGFTLVELLVVIAILGLLSVLAFPGLRQAFVMGDRGSDISNLRRIGTALFSYSADNNNNFPVAGGVLQRGQIDSVTRSGPWIEQLDPYLGISNPVLITSRTGLRFRDGKEVLGYFLGSRPAVVANGRWSSVNLLRMQAPSHTVLAGLVAASNMFAALDWDRDDYTQSPAFDSQRRSRLPNGSPVPILFADGHVRECPFFDTNSMTTEYEKGRWYGF